jgi:hypothetical protein
MDDAEFERWVRLLEARTGVTVPPERKPFLLTGLRRRMRETGHTEFAALLRRTAGRRTRRDGVGGAGRSPYRARNAFLPASAFAGADPR